MKDTLKNLGTIGIVVWVVLVSYSTLTSYFETKAGRTALVGSIVATLFVALVMLVVQYLRNKD